ncbi:MAG: extracellular solute-binding protein [Deinococcales bacterium]
MLRRIILMLAVAVAGLAMAQTEIRVISFSQGFAFPDLFGTSGTEQTAILKQFEQANNIKVTIEWGDEASVRQKVLTDLISGGGRYDIILLGSDGAVQTYGYAGFLEPLEGYLASGDYSQYIDMNDVFPSITEANTVNGHLYGLSYYAFGPGIIYRTDLFKKYNVKVPTTIPELETALQQLKDGFAKDGITDVYPLTMRGAPGEEPTLDLAGFVYAMAGYPAWFEGGAVTPDQIRATKAKPIFTGDFKPGFAEFVKLAREYGPPGIATHTWVDMMNIYSQGKAAMLLPSAINGYAALTSTENKTVLQNSDFAPIVVGPTGKPVESFWSFSFGINKASKHKADAMKVLAFLTGERSLQEFANRTQWPSVPFESVMKSQVLIDKWGAEEVALNAQAMANANPKYFPYIPELSDFMDRIGTAASKAISTGDVDGALNDLQAWALQRMQLAGYYN